MLKRIKRVSKGYWGLVVLLVISSWNTEPSVFLYITWTIVTGYLIWKRWRETKLDFHKNKFPPWILATISSICKLLWKGFRFYPHRGDLALQCVSCWLHPYSHFLRFDDSIFYLRPYTAYRLFTNSVIYWNTHHCIRLIFNPILGISNLSHNSPSFPSSFTNSLLLRNYKLWTLTLFGLPSFFFYFRTISKIQFLLFQLLTFFLQPSGFSVPFYKLLIFLFPITLLKSKILSQTNIQTTKFSI